MPVSLPYLLTFKNLPTLFAKIGSAKIPDKFTRDFFADDNRIKGHG